MKTIAYTYGPVELHLYLNGEAMFALDEMDSGKEDGRPDILERIQQQTADGISALCDVAVILATQGELCRRYLRYTPTRIPTAKELKLLLSPMQMLSLRSAVIHAINDGWTQTDPDDDGDVDTGLMELEKKTKL